MPESTTIKGAVGAVAVAALVALVSSQVQPWWWCKAVGGCAQASSSGGGVASPPASNAASPDVGVKDPPSQRTAPRVWIEATPARMSALEMGMNRQGKDYNDGAVVADAATCRQMCAADDSCQAMTYVFPEVNQRLNGHCWLKGETGSARANDYMISAYKITAVPGHWSDDPAF